MQDLNALVFLSFSKQLSWINTNYSDFSKYINASLVVVDADWIADDGQDVFHETSFSMR